MFSQKIRMASLMLTLLALSSTLIGQTSTGGVNGIVTDPSGAAVTAATVKLINKATNIETPASPNQSGYFTFVNVRPGNYILRIEAGFCGNSERQRQLRQWHDAQHH